MGMLTPPAPRRGVPACLRREGRQRESCREGGQSPLLLTLVGDTCRGQEGLCQRPVEDPAMRAQLTCGPRCGVGGGQPGDGAHPGVAETRSLELASYSKTTASLRPRGGEAVVDPTPGVSWGLGCCWEGDLPPAGGAQSTLE